jgi:site-specific recombinase, phage integrase family
MGKVNVLKRGNVYQYKFEIAPVGLKTRVGFLTKNEAIKVGIKAYTEYMNTGHAFTPNEIFYSDYLDYWMKEHCEVNL